MMNRLLTIFFFGTLFWMAFDFIFYAGLMVNYIEAHGIPIFFNEFFTDTQYWWLWIIGISLYGTIFLVKNKTREKILFFLLSCMLAAIPWIPDFGEQIGRAIFSKENVAYRFDNVLVKNATLLYSGRGYDYVVIPGNDRTLRYLSSKRVK
ncbi:hypothetical protein [Hydrogenimonas cancrithermarum]|nr:hypothetical protein [Hydrogenimonas cancrithermarum]